MADHDELITRFIEISGGDENVAQFYLSSSNWSLEDALSNFLGNQAEDEAPTPERTRPTNDVDMDNANAATGTQQPKASGSNSSNEGDFSKVLGPKPKFATLNDMSKRTANEEEGQAFYAGGSERSGQQVLGPPKRKNFREQLTDIFKMTQEQRDSDDGGPAPSTSANTNWGQGIRLGMTSSDHTVLPAAETAHAKGEKRPQVVLKLWSQGFSVDDGELRLYDDPQNKEFLETVMRGEIPHELLEMGGMVNVDVEDHRHEDYKSPTTKTKVFKGSGQALGSPVPNVESAPAVPPTTAAATAAPASNASDDENAAKTKLKFNSSAPSTSLQIRLADGSRLTAQFNLSHTIDDIQEYIRNARPQYRDRIFILISTFPTRDLTDLGGTIEAYNLKNASLMQRLQ